MRATVLAILLVSAVTTVTGITTGPDNRIVGGIRSNIGQFPELVSVLSNPVIGESEHLCGGLILNDNHILTTATCVQDRGALYLKVMGAGINLGGSAGFEEYKNVQKIFLHENFDLATKTNDLAVLRTSNNFVFVNGLINPATLPPNNTEPENGSLVSLGGWGREIYEGPPNMWQNTINATYISHAECTTFYGDALDVYNACIIGERGQGVCDGDEGGPIIQDGVSVAMISWNNGCDAYPGVVTQLSPYLDWILGKFES